MTTSGTVTQDGQTGAAAPVLDGAVAACPAYAATPLPVLGGAAFAAAPAGIALAFAGEAADACGEDRFALLLVDAEGEVIGRLGPFADEDVVAIWRDLSARSGLPRMIVRDDGGVSAVGTQLGRLLLGKVRQRRRVGSLNGRRPRFLVRRKATQLPARPRIHRGENEIIART